MNSQTGSRPTDPLNEASRLFRESFSYDVSALLPIAAEVLRRPADTTPPALLGKGAFADAYALYDDIVARVILPVRPCMKTEAEVAAMNSVKGCLQAWSFTSRAYIISYRVCQWCPCPQGFRILL